ncbi:MAG: hypothetical protein IPJ71_04785 [Bdellovibrionales bacterium]|nr:hypothetical protein [Bdellovibrionales bacterium]
MINPWLGFSCVALTFVISFCVFIFSSIPVGDYYFISVFFLIGIYSINAILRDKTAYQVRKWLKQPLKILGKYVFWGFISYAPILLYRNHSFYSQNFLSVVPFFEFYFKAYIIGGLPYFILSEKYRYSFGNVFSDPYLRVLSLLRQLLRGRFRNTLRRLIFHRSYRSFLLSSFLRLHFLPVMLGQLIYAQETSLKSLAENSWNYAEIISFLTTLVWAIDANNASIGYFWESNFTKTRFKMMDFHPLHWIITLSCYVPFTYWASTFVPSLMDYNSAVFHLVDSRWFEVTTDLIGLIFLIGYLCAGTSLYFSTSNLTYKAIQTRGLYSIVRHPATLCKIGFFGVSCFKFSEAYTFINIFAYLLWTGIYLSRTYCEERFLMQFEEYRAYRKRVKYRLIPGVY